MRIQAKVVISCATEEEKTKINKLFCDSNGGIDAVSVLDIFPSQVRFCPDLLVDKKWPGLLFDLYFDILGCEK